MRIAIIGVGLLLLAGPAFAADPIEGEWLVPDGGSKVRIGDCHDKPGQMCGVVSWLSPANAKNLDTKNPNAALRTRPILGVATIMGFRSSASGQWTGGKMYDPGSGKTYDGKLSANPNGTLKVQGCVLMVCETQTWKRG